MGMETWTYLRMGAWTTWWGGLSGKLWFEHPEWRVRLRDGRDTDKMSYFYPEVRQYVVDMFREQIRSCRLMSHLAESHEVDLVTHADDLQDLQHRQMLETTCRSVSPPAT